MSPSLVIKTIINYINNTLRIICRADRPLDVQGIRRTEQQQQPAASPGSRPAQVSPVRRRRVHQYGEAILPVPHPVTPPSSPTPAILPVPRPLMPPSSPVILPVRHSRPTAGMSTSRLPRILRDLQRE